MVRNVLAHRKEEQIGLPLRQDLAAHHVSHHPKIFPNVKHNLREMKCHLLPRIHVINLTLESALKGATYLNHRLTRQRLINHLPPYF